MTRMYTNEKKLFVIIRGYSCYSMILMNLFNLCHSRKMYEREFSFIHGFLFAHDGAGVF